MLRTASWLISSTQILLTFLSEVTLIWKSYLKEESLQDTVH